MEVLRGWGDTDIETDVHFIYGLKDLSSHLISFIPFLGVSKCKVSSNVTR